MMKHVLTGVAMLLLAATAFAGGGDRDGSALQFDGVDDYVQIPDPIAATGPLTLECWVRADEFTGGRIMSNRDTSDGYEVDIVPDGRLRFTVNGNVYADADISAHLGEWIHVAVTWEGPVTGAIHIYVDGDLVTDGFETTAMVPTPANLTIGRPAWVDLYFFHGAIDEVRVFDTVVSQENIRIWMTRLIGPDHPDYAHLVGAWSFEDGSGQVAAGEVPGTDGQLGSTSGVDADDPTWITSGMVATQAATWGAVKTLFGQR